jgi:uncharacterized repeat protein (TIGR01451 family)
MIMPINFTGFYSQNFNSLPTSGSSAWIDNVTISGWYTARTGTGTTIVANNGSNNAGNLYSYGIDTQVDRALGSVGSANATAGNFWWGVRLVNNTGNTINALDINYVGEQWRYSGTASPQTVDFQYQIGATGLTIGNWIDFDALDFISPITSGTAGLLNGNLAANRTFLSSTLSGISVAPGQEIWFRWSDLDHPGNDHGLAIDDFSVSVSTPQPDLTISLSASPNPVTAGTGNILTYTLTASNNGTANATGVNIDFTLPAGITLLNTTQNNGFNRTGNSGTISFTGGNIDTGSSVVLTANVEVYNAGTLTSGNAIIDPNNIINESNETNNIATGISTTVNVGQPDLQVGISTPSPLTVGTPFNYTLDIQNNGGDRADNIELNFTLPPNVTYNSVNIFGGNFSSPTINNSTLIFTGGSINPGSFTQINVNVTPTQAGVLGATTLVADPNNIITESNELNNSITTGTFTVNPTVGVTITESDGSTNVTEGGATDSYTIVLNTQPTNDVNITINFGTQVTTNPSIIAFTTTNWNLPQTVTVTAIDDPVIEGNHTQIISHTATSNDNNYNQINIASITANITDNDVENQPVFPIDESNQSNNADNSPLETINNNDTTPTITPILLSCDCEDLESLINNTYNGQIFESNPPHDLIVGNDNDDVFFGGIGNDSIFGGSGDDLLFGNQDQDFINGNKGNDTIFGGKDNDFVRGGQDNDLLFGDLGNDTLVGDRGNDTVFGMLGDDILLGGEGDDFINGNQGKDTISGGEGNDILHGGQDDDKLCGNNGNDTLFGDFGDDTICGCAGDDVIFGGAGNDLLFGGAGNDTIEGGAGSDIFVLTSGKGTNTFLDFAITEDKLGLTGELNFQNLTIIQGTGSQANDTLIRIANSNEFLALLIGVSANSLTANMFTIVEKS